MKRPAASNKFPIEKKPKVVQPRRDPAILKVEKGILCTDIPESAAQMLTEMLDFSLGTPEDQRNQYQKDVVNMIGSVLEKHANSASERAAQAKVSISELEEATNKQSEIIEAVEKRELAASATVKQKTADLAASATVFQAAKLESNEKLMQVNDAKMEFLKEKQNSEKLEKAMAEIFQPMCETGVPEGSPSEGVETKVMELCFILSMVNFESAAIAALPAILQKPTSKRGSFDAMVLKQVEADAQDRAEKFKEREANEEQNNALKDSQLQESRKRFEQARKQQMGDVDALKLAQSEETELIDTKVAEERKLTDISRQIRKNQKDVEVQTRLVEKINQGPLASFKELRDRVSQQNSQEDATIQADDDVEVDDQHEEIAAKPVEELNKSESMQTVQA